MDTNLAPTTRCRLDMFNLASAVYFLPRHMDRYANQRNELVSLRVRSHPSGPITAN